MRHALRSPQGVTDTVPSRGNRRPDVHKKMLAVVVAHVEVDGDFSFERQKTGTTPLDMRRLAGRARGRGSRRGKWCCARS
jgi:hypothetical protein